MFAGRLEVALSRSHQLPKRGPVRRHDQLIRKNLLKDGSERKDVDSMIAGFALCLLWCAMKPIVPMTEPNFVGVL